MGRDDSACKLKAAMNACFTNLPRLLLSREYLPTIDVSDNSFMFLNSSIGLKLSQKLLIN